MKKIIKVGNVQLGTGKVLIQSMTNTPTKNVAKTVEQIKKMQEAGAELVRISIPDRESAEAVGKIVKNVSVPLIGDIHFSSEPALIAIENGISKIRINPYNMSKESVKETVKKCAEYHIPIRVGVNKGSSSQKKSPAELADSAVECAAMIEDLGWDKLVLAVKSSDVRETVEAYHVLSEKTDYPLHVGLTEAGTPENGIVKSAVAIGSLLLDGIGDTIRVSLTTNPVEEVYAAKRILRAVGLDTDYVEVIACPTCARTEIDVERLAKSIEQCTREYDFPLKIAVMGCVVNGIGESKGADLGVAGGKKRSVLIKDGEILKTIENENIEKELIRLIEEKRNGK